MRIGIFARTFTRSTLEEVLDAVRAQGLDCVQFNLTCAGLPSLPDRIESELASRIRAEMGKRRITMAAVSGTFNMIHPDFRERCQGLHRLRVLAAACQQLGTSVVTLCTGSRDPENMWKWHVDNDSPDAWNDLVKSMAVALEIAEEHGVTLAFEPEIANVVDSAAKGRRLIEEMGSDRLKIVMDGANLFHAGELKRLREVLDDAFKLLGEHIVIAHAKDLSLDGEAGHEAAGTGLLDYDYYLNLLRVADFDGPLILHNLSEAQVPGCVSFLRRKLEHQTK